MGLSQHRNQSSQIPRSCARAGAEQAVANTWPTISDAHWGRGVELEQALKTGMTEGTFMPCLETTVAIRLPVGNLLGCTLAQSYCSGPTPHYIYPLRGQTAVRCGVPPAACETVGQSAQPIGLTPCRQCQQFILSSPAGRWTRRDVQTFWSWT